MWSAFVIPVAAGLVSGLTAAGSQDPPTPPNQADLVTEGARQDAATLEDRRRVEMAAQQGRNLSLDFTKQSLTKAQINAELNKLNKQIKAAGKKDTNALRSQRDVLRTALNNVPAGTSDLLGKHAGAVDVYTDKNGAWTAPEIATANFEGLGAADVARVNSDKNAANSLALQQKYGPQFLQQAMKELELANPEGKAARDRQYELIQQQINENPARPVADLLDKQVGEQLNAGNRVTGVSREMLDRAVTEANASRGGASGPATDYAEPMETGFAGEQRRQAGMAKAQGWLASGATPEDVRYRREQANKANLSAFVNGQTPQSQFENLSGAGQGPAPYYQGQQLTQPDPGAGRDLANAGMNAYQTNLQYQATQTPNWFAGITSLLSAGAAGLKYGG